MLETELDVAALLDDAVDLYRPAAEAKSQQLQLRIDDGLRLRGDRDLLFQAWANLLDNAVKFTPPGGAIHAVARWRDGVEIRVRDTGGGVPEDAAARITERFYRAPGSETKEGVGLGLSLVAAVAEAHGAELGFSTVDGMFEVRLCFPPARSSISAA